MAAPAVVTNSGPPLCPSFAEVCSFMERYGPALDLPELTFLQMERYLRDTSAGERRWKEKESCDTDRRGHHHHVPKPLVELHVKLLRKLGRSVTTDRWEKYLAKVCQELNSTWAWELEQKGYQEMSMECKSSILKYLCECQFDENLKFKTFVNDEDPEKMRLQPVGRDRQGLMYWLQLDHEQNIRLFTEEQDDLDGSTWKCIVRTRNDLAEAVELLRAQVGPNQSRNQNQAGSRSNSPAAKDTAAGEGESGLCCSKPPQTSEERSHTEEERLKEDVKRDDATPIKLEDMEVKEKTELRPAAFDNRVSTITAIKQELKDEAQNAVPVVMAPSVVLTKVNLVEEAERAVVRSNQQAKIPLKKRDLKLADSFHSNHLSNSSSIIVCNPAVIHSQDGREKAPPGSPASSQQQLLVSAQRQELTNGRASHLPLKEGQNGVVGVKGQAGAVSHVGVIRGPSEYHRATGAEQQEQNGPSPELHRTRVVEEDKELTRKSVLVRKGPPEGGATPAPPFLPPHAGMGDEKLLKQSSCQPDGAPEASERSADSVGITSPSATPQPRRRQEENRDKAATKESEETRDAGSPQQKDEDPRVTGEKVVESSSSVSSVKRGGGLNGRVSTKNLQFGSEPKQNPLEEVSSELQKEGIRLKIKIPPHRRNKLRRKGGKAREPEEQEEGRSLRRSVRICRSSALPSCRLSAKVAESQRKKLQTKPALPVRTREVEEEDEGDEEEPRRTCGPAGKLRKRRGKRRHGRPRWTVVRSKRRRPDEDLQDSGRTAGEEEEEEEEEGGSHSEEELYKSEEVPREDACTHCGLPNHPELILLCDSCDGGYHTACLRPPLMLIPDGEWFCPPCQHKMLCEKLEEQLQNLDSALKKRERAERRRERLVYVGISVENIIPEGDEEEEEEKTEKQKDSKKSKNLGRRSTRTRKHISYRFDDFDDAIDEAIEEDIRDLCGEDGKQSQQPVRNQSRSARSRKRRRLNDLESDSTAVESEDEFMLSNSSEDEEFGASGAEDDGEEEGDEEAGSEVGSWDRGTRPKRGPKNKPKRTRHRGRKWQQRRSSEDEDSDVELGERTSSSGMLTKTSLQDSDRYSDMSDSDAERKRRGLRRGQRQQVNYRETSESSDNSRASSVREKVKRRGRPRKEHLSSDYSDVSPSSRDSEGDEEEEDDQKRRVSQRRREDGDESRKRHRDQMDVGEKGRRLKRRQLEKEEDKDQRKRLMRTDRKEEDPDKMGRGKRRERLSQQRRKRLAQMLKKRRPSTDEEEEEEESEEDSSSSDDRPIRKRLNRIDSDDEEEEEPKMMNKKSSVGERWAENTNSDAQERGRGQNLSPSNGHQTSRGQEKSGTGSPAVLRDRAGSGRKERHNRPLDLAEGGHSDSVQNGPRS
ncbi:remodeling and spacing factor 1 isoform X4 [Nothobranchius furzeri]|uniref:remodeling and spacing factor 1 isoform X4 n=1 Tax=Nothobranchius furzeri TaxID=105023 RepID=UPI0024041B76|nr:remodeling and spacing factor 1 isoform X4 [Nothobranchius furzeri]